MNYHLKAFQALLLFSIVSILTTTASEDSLLHIACRNNRTDDVTQLLLTEAHLLNALGIGKQTPIMSATLVGHVNIVKILM